MLTRDALSLHLDERMATRMGGHDTIRVGFDLSDAVFRKLRHVPGLIMRGYESQLEMVAERGAAPDRSMRSVWC
jgi:hypothetical protein